MGLLQFYWDFHAHCNTPGAFIFGNAMLHSLEDQVENLLLAK